TSPAWAPPIPSATTNSGARVKTESSLALRWRPVSVRTAESSILSAIEPLFSVRSLLEPEHRVADLDRVAVDQLRLVAEAGAVQQGAVGRVHVLHQEPIAAG